MHRTKKQKQPHRRKLAACAGVGLAPLLVLGLTSTPAEAHGWITNPASRQEQCASGVVSCGSIKWEPQSVEGPKGLKDCAGGNERFADLRDDSKGWRVTDVGSSTDFNWKFTARHRTANWQYFIGNTKIAEIDGRGAQPPETVSHHVDFRGFTGKQKVLAVWNIADTANAFYACVDVNIRG
ncbi:lytic polysaccharide monooxygenase auxiliary activity family 9 protein [Streptomyces sp. 891-h]|uniref:lytic polysaccharide monooxygenase auxiliary activity family 9 protein n=1 Tax=unclassified Streptomyces TaxID=2593676 RepID=UPI001FAAC528|nr:lytic polysaccharide monooxygenase auxiliary activity family 9 protein [Streptomyces sp. 891-h]UNZ16365.1 chitin-binding protein [Streptomyces sp. 891-h]